MWAVLSLFILYLAALAAGVYEDGMNLFQFMAVFPDAMNAPFSLHWTPYTVKFMLGALLLYVGGIVLYYSSNENKRPGEEHGSARWGNVWELNKKYSDKDPDKNVILTKHLCMSLNGRQHMRNLLQIVVGGSGAGKTRFVVKPNLLLANTSFICTDPKGELVRAVAPFLLQQGYVVKVFDLIEPSHSDSYNPFRYIRKDSDVFRLISNFIQNTTPKNASQNDPFWEKSEIALDSALMLYLLHESPPYEQTLEMMLTMIEYGGAKEDDDDYISQLKALFKDDWEGIIGNADTFVYLGGNEQSTHKYVSELLGKETISTKSSSQSKGRNGSYSQSIIYYGGKRMKKSTTKRAKIFMSVWSALILCVAFLTTSAFAADGDPIAVVNNLSDFIFSAIKAIGVIILGWGIVQVGMSMQTGRDFKDLICPDSISFKRNHFEFGGKVGRVLFLRTYASFLTDDLISDLTEYARDLILSIDMIPVPTDEAVKEVESIILGVETDITRWQQRQNSKNNFTAEVPRSMEQKRENSREFMDDLTQNDQRMIFSLITIVHTADSLEELDSDTESLIAIGKEHLCDISPARFQQEDGLNTVLPYGLRRLHHADLPESTWCWRLF